MTTSNAPQSFTANFTHNAPVKERQKSIHIWQIYRQEFGILLYDSWCKDV